MVKIYLRVLELQVGNIARQKSVSISKKKEQLRVLIVESTFLNYQFCILSPRVGPGWLAVTCQASWWWKPGGLEDGHQEVGSCLVVWIMDVGWMSGGLHMWVLQGVIKGLSGCLVYVQVWTHNELMYIQTLTQDWKVQKIKFPG